MAVAVRRATGFAAAGAGWAGAGAGAGSEAGAGAAAAAFSTVCWPQCGQVTAMPRALAGKEMRPLQWAQGLFRYCSWLMCAMLVPAYTGGGVRRKNLVTSCASASAKSTVAPGARCREISSRS